MSTAEHITALHKSLGDPTRLRILAVLDGSELRVSEIVEILDMGQSRISRHLRILVESGVLTLRRSGVWTFYQIDEGGAFRSIVEESVSLLPGHEHDIARKERVLAERRDETRLFFDGRATQWETMKRQLLGDVDPDRIALESISGFDSVADLGCGDGGLVSLMSESTGTVIGVDNAPAMIEYARRRLESRRGVEFRLGEVEHLPMKDGEVECAVMSLVLHHLPAPGLAIREAVRVIGKSGRLVILEFGAHEHEYFRDAHGDRWLGIDGSRIVEWIEEYNCIVEEYEEYALPEELVLHSIIASKTRNGDDAG
jgi:ubiquinone/menaquinone biosynthesis C-methylase UbiE/DNA-binding transcriptional ArsR family regulator